MARIKDLKKEQREVRRIVRRLNKQLREDCFAGRFEVRQTNRICHNYQNGWCDTTGLDDSGNPMVAGHGYPLWYTANYEFEFIDHEEPERNKKDWFNYHEALNGMFNGSKSIYGVMNDFIINSDFWKKWEDLEYQKTHWYSGTELERMIKDGGVSWETPEARAAYKKTQDEK